MSKPEEAATTIKPVVPLNATKEDASNQKHTGNVPNLISSPSLEATEKIPAKSETQTKPSVSISSKIPHLFEPRPFSLNSRKESSTTVKTETTTPAAKVSEHTSTSSGLRQNGFYDDVNSVSSDNSTLQRERSKFINRNSIRSYSNEDAEEEEKKTASLSRIRNPNRVRFTPPTSTATYDETEEERLKRIRAFRPNVELADLSSLTAADISTINQGFQGRGNIKRNRLRPTVSTTTPLTPTTVSARSKFRFKQNEINRRTHVDDDDVESTQQETQSPKPFRRNRKIIRRIRPTAASTTTTVSEKPEEVIATTTKASIGGTTVDNIETNTVIEETSRDVLTTSAPATALESDNETDNNQEREDILKSPEEGENIKLSESVRQESSVNNGIAVGDVKRPRKVIKINIPGKQDITGDGKSSTTESGIIIRTRKIIRKLHPTKAPILDDSVEEEAASPQRDSDVIDTPPTSNSSTEATEEKPKRPSFFSRRKPSRFPGTFAGDSSEKQSKTASNNGNEPKIVPFTNKRRFGTKYSGNRDKQGEVVVPVRPQFRQRTSTTATVNEISSSSIATTESLINLRPEISSTTEASDEDFTTTADSLVQEATTRSEDEDATELLSQTTVDSEDVLIETSTADSIEANTELVTTTEQGDYAEILTTEDTTVPFEMASSTSSENYITTQEVIDLSTESTTDLANNNETVSTESQNQPIFNNPLYKPPGARVPFNVPRRLSNISPTLESITPERTTSRGYLSRKYQRKHSFTPKPTIENEEVSAKTTTPITPHTTKAHSERKGYRHKDKYENQTEANHLEFSEEHEEEVANNRYGEAQGVTLKPTENTSLYRNSLLGRYKGNQTTTPKSKPLRFFGSRQRTTAAPPAQDSREINIEAINLRNKNLFSKTRKMNIPHPGSSARPSGETEQNISSTETFSSPTPASVPETTEQQTTLLHVFAVTESLEDIKATDVPKEAEHSNNKTLQKLIEINRIVEVHAKGNKSENREGDILDAVPVVDKLGVITRLVEIKIVDGGSQENLASHEERNDRKFESHSKGDNIDPIVALKNYGGTGKRNNIEIIDSKSQVKTITPNPLFNDASTIALEGLFSNMKGTEYGEAEEDELLNTQNSNLLKVRVLEQEGSSSEKRMKYDYNANFIPLTILKQDEEKARVIEVPPPQQTDEMIKIAPVSLLRIEMGDASHIIHSDEQKTTER